MTGTYDRPHTHTPVHIHPVMPPKGTTKHMGLVASRRAISTPFVPAYHQLKEYREEETKDGVTNKLVSKEVPLSQVIHWPSHLTRPVNSADVEGKTEMIVSKNGWLDVYSVMGRALTKEEREHLRWVRQDHARQAPARPRPRP